jgi:hypothetical protein
MFLKNMSLTGMLLSGSIALNAGSLIYIKSLRSDLVEAHDSVVLYESANKDMASKIELQNAALKEGESKYNATQTALDKVSGKNDALTSEFSKFRKELGGKPVPTTCPESINDLKTVVQPLATDWNKK